MHTEETPRPYFSAMTVNERLFVAELMKDFDDAWDRGDGAAMISILMQVDLSEELAAGSVDALIANPNFYGK